MVNICKMAAPPPPLAVLRGHDDAVVSLQFMYENLLCSGSTSGILKAWDLTSLRSARTIRAHDKSILSINTLSGKDIVTTSRDGTIKLWDMACPMDTPLSILTTGHDHFCNSTILNASTERPIVVAPGRDQSQILLWDARTDSFPARTFRPSNGEVGMVTSLCTIPTSAEHSADNLSPWLIMAGYEDGSVHVFDIRQTDSALATAKLHSEPVFALSALSSSKGIRVASGGGDATLQRTTLKIVDEGQVGGGTTLDKLDSIALPHPGTSCIRHRSDGRLLVSTHWDHTVRVYDQKRLKPLAVLKQHRDSVYAVEFGIPRSAVNTEQRTIAEEKKDVVEEPSAQQYSAGTSIGEGSERGGAVFATGSKDCTIALWDLFADSFQP